MTIKKFVPVGGGGYLVDSIIMPPSMVLSREVRETTILGRDFLHVYAVFDVEFENDSQKICARRRRRLPRRQHHHAAVDGA